jgi:hypothetical protein
MTKHDLPAAIATVERELEAARKQLPDWDPRDYSRDFFAKRTKVMTALAARLEQEVGAKITDRYDGARCRIGGFSSSSTMGIESAVVNWLYAARKRAA